MLLGGYTEALFS